MGLIKETKTNDKKKSVGMVKKNIFLSKMKGDDMEKMHRFDYKIIKTSGNIQISLKFIKSGYDKIVERVFEIYVNDYMNNYGEDKLSIYDNLYKEYEKEDHEYCVEQYRHNNYSNKDMKYYKMNARQDFYEYCIIEDIYYIVYMANISSETELKEWINKKEKNEIKKENKTIKKGRRTMNN